MCRRGASVLVRCGAPGFDPIAAGGNAPPRSARCGGHQCASAARRRGRDPSALRCCIKCDDPAVLDRLCLHVFRTSTNRSIGRYKYPLPPTDTQRQNYRGLTPFRPPAADRSASSARIRSVTCATEKRAWASATPAPRQGLPTSRVILAYTCNHCLGEGGRVVGDHRSPAPFVMPMALRPRPALPRRARRTPGCLPPCP